MNALRRCIFPSPLGDLYAIAIAQALLYLDWKQPKIWTQIEDGSAEALLKRLQQELEAYFAGQLRIFSLPLAPEGTVLQKQAWNFLRMVPYGETRSYAFIARAMGKAQATRAIGGMVGRNPISIIIPCHRIIGSNGRLTGYAGGLERKRFLLDLEGASYR